MTDIELKDGSEMEKQGAAELRKENQREDGKMDRYGWRWTVCQRTKSLPE